MRTIILVVGAALPALSQGLTREVAFTPWLQGDRESTRQILSVAVRDPLFGSFARRLAAEFATEGGSYPEARALLTQAKKGGDPPELLNRREARLRAALGDFTGAEKAALWGHRWDGTNIKRLKVNNILSLNALGEVYAARGFHEMAIAIWQKSLKASRSEWAPEWSEAKVLIALSRLALNDLSGARANAEEALDFCRKKWGDFGPRTIDAKDALGLILAAQGELDQAETLIAFAFEHRQYLYGGNHAKVAASHLHVARLMAARKQYEKALEFSTQALKIMEVALPGANVRTAFALVEAAEIDDAAGKSAEAREKLETAARLMALFLGENAPSVRALGRKLAT